MADRKTELRWLSQLTSIPTVPGHEHRVLDWVTGWAERRNGDVAWRRDRHGNLFLTLKGRKPSPPVVAVAHVDHPGFVVTASGGRHATVEFRGGVRPEYFAGSRVEIFGEGDESHTGTLTEFDPRSSTGTVTFARSAPVGPGDIGRWSFDRRRLGIRDEMVHAPACDDLAGVAAALAALDRARRDPSRRHFAVLLTRAEEVGFVGAIGAARDATLPAGSRVLSIECSRAYPDSPVGGGPVVRVGDASSIFDHRLTNLIADAARESGLRHQRKLMAGGSCEATAFVAYGYAATGLCLPLGNYHNMGNLDEVEAGTGEAEPRPEIVSVDDYHGLVDLLAVAATAVDDEWDLTPRLDERFETEKHLL